jgi:hypothetical protein
MKKNEMGGAREKYGRERTGLVAKTEGKRLLGDLDTDDRIILNWILNK